jgi:hypothetical protein
LSTQRARAQINLGLDLPAHSQGDSRNAKALRQVGILRDELLRLAQQEVGKGLELGPKAHALRQIGAAATWSAHQDHPDSLEKFCSDYTIIFTFPGSPPKANGMTIWGGEGRAQLFTTFPSLPGRAILFPSTMWHQTTMGAAAFLNDPNDSVHKITFFAALTSADGDRRPRAAKKPKVRAEDEEMPNADAGTKPPPPATDKAAKNPAAPQPAKERRQKKRAGL